MIEFVVGIILLVLLTLSFSEILSRYFFNAPLTWVTEVCRFLLIWMVFLGATVITKKASHLSVGVSLENYLTGRGRLILRLFVRLCIACVLLLVAIYGSKSVLMTSKMVATTSKIPMYMVWSAIPINAAIMLYYIIKDLFSFEKANS